MYFESGYAFELYSVNILLTEICYKLSKYVHIAIKSQNTIHVKRKQKQKFFIQSACVPDAGEHVVQVPLYRLPEISTNPPNILM